MRVNSFFFVIIAILYFIFGVFLAPTIFQLEIFDCDFFNVRAIEIVRILIMVILGCYVAYYVSIKSSNNQKIKDLCINEIASANDMLKEQKNITILFMKKESELNKEDSKKKGAIVNNGFKKISNKIRMITSLCEKIHKNGSLEESVKILQKESKELKKEFGDKFMSGEGYGESDISLIIKRFNSFDLLFDNIKIEILSV